MEVVDKEIAGQGQRTGGQSEQGLPRGRLRRGKEVMKLKRE